MGYVYLITNLVNGKRYVGQTWRSTEERWIEHTRTNKKKLTILQKAVAKYGQSSFAIETLASSASQLELDNLERLWIAVIGTRQDGYNISLGGTAFPKHSPESRAKMAACRRGKRMSTEQRARLSAAHKGHKLSDKTRLKMSLVRRGRPSDKKGIPLSDEHKRKIAETLRGIKRSPETRARMSACKKGIPVSAEQRRRISQTLTGRTGHIPTEETRAKLRLARSRQAPITEEARAKLRAAWVLRKARQYVAV